MKYITSIVIAPQPDENAWSSSSSTADPPTNANAPASALVWRMTRQQAPVPHVYDFPRLRNLGVRILLSHEHYTQPRGMYQRARHGPFGAASGLTAESDSTRHRQHEPVNSDDGTFDRLSGSRRRVKCSMYMYQDPQRRRRSIGG